MGKPITVQKNIVLIDFENVKPKHLSRLKTGPFEILFFLGAQQPRLDVSLVTSLHAFGPARAKYITISKPGKNSLDFHLIYYLGVSATKNPNAHFHIITGDKGFDALVHHLRGAGLNIHRREAVADIPILKLPKTKPVDAKLAAVVKNLEGRGASKPCKDKTLKNTIRKMFAKDLTPAEVERLFKQLLTRKYICSKDGKITYALPA